MAACSICGQELILGDIYTFRGGKPEHIKCPPFAPEQEQSVEGKPHSPATSEAENRGPDSGLPVLPEGWERIPAERWTTYRKTTWPIGWEVTALLSSRNVSICLTDCINAELALELSTVLAIAARECKGGGE